MKYAVIRTGGKQYLVQENATIETEKLPDDEGKAVKFDEVLLLVDNGNIKVGRPFVAATSVRGKVMSHIKGVKKHGIKYQRGKYRTKFGHRQSLTRVQIEQIGRKKA